MPTPNSPTPTPAQPPKEPMAAPSPPPAAAPARPSLDDDLMAIVSKPAAKGGTPAPEKPPEAPAAPEGGAPPAEGAKPAPAPDPGSGKGVPDEDEYLFGGSKPAVKPGEPAAAPPTKPGEPAAAQAPVPPATPGETKGPMKIPEIRAEYHKIKERNAVLEKELTELKAKAAAPAPVDDAERKAFTEQISALKKQVDEASASVRAAAYEQSDEYKAKFEQPFIDTWNDGIQQVTTLTVTDSDGNTRKGTADDFAAIMREPSNERAAAAAQEMFGTNAFYVLAQRRDLQRLNAARNKALDEYKATAAEREKADKEALKQQREEFEGRRIKNAAMFQKLNEQAATKHPQHFGPIDGDAEGNALLERGYRDADLAFNIPPDMPDEQRIRLHSALRNRAGAFGRALHLIAKRDARIAELEKELGELRGSAPDGGKESVDGGTPRRLTADEEFEAAAAKRR